MRSIVHKHNIPLIKIFWMAFIALIVFSGLYMYFIGQTVFAAAEREATEERVVELQTHISELELALIEQRRMVTREYAYTQGFVEVDQTVFVKRDPTTRLSLRNQ